jgi:hypothetical protein
LCGQSALGAEFGDPGEQPSTIRQESVEMRDRGEVTWRYRAPSRQWQDVPMLPSGPVFGPIVNRRRVLTGGAAVAVLALVAPGCSSPPAPPAVDELEAQLTLARQDSELATAAAVGTEQQVGAALNQVAAERNQHAQALATEIKRLAPTSSTSPTTTATSPAVAAAPPPLASVVKSLKASADSARDVAATSSGYRAGLLGSIAASCTASYSVALAFGAAAS